MSDYIVAIDDLYFGYNSDREIFKGVDLNIRKGQLVGIVGSSGQGKTSLLKLINGSLLNHHGSYRGNIRFMDRNINDFPNLNRFIGTVYQNPDHQIVFTNVVDEIVFGMENYNYSKDLIHEKLNWILELLKIQHLKDRNPNLLSSGEKQLVVLASVLCLDVELLLLDEAFSAVDEERASYINDLIKILKDQGKTLILVEHDYSHFVYADRIIRLEDGHLLEEKRD